MRFDSIDHKNFALQLLNASNFPGNALEFVLGFKQAVTRAGVEGQDRSTGDTAKVPPKELETPKAKEAKAEVTPEGVQVTDKRAGE